MRFFIKTKLLKAICAIPEKKDIYATKESVCICPTAGTIKVTNGHVVAIIEGVEFEETSNIKELIIPRRVFEKFFRNTKPVTEYLCITDDPNADDYMKDVGITTVLLLKFPDDNVGTVSFPPTDRVISINTENPRRGVDTSKALPCFNLDFLMKVGKIAHEIDEKENAKAVMWDDKSCSRQNILELMKSFDNGMKLTAAIASYRIFNRE